MGKRVAAWVILMVAAGLAGMVIGHEMYHSWREACKIFAFVSGIVAVSVIVAWAIFTIGGRE